MGLVPVDYESGWTVDNAYVHCTYLILPKLSLTSLVRKEKFKIPKLKFHLSTPASSSVSNKDNIGFTEDLKMFIRRSDLKRASRMLFSPR